MKRPPAELAARLRAVANEVLAPDRAPSIDEMAATAEIPRATLYYYFAGRDDLVDFLLLDKVEAVAEEIRAAAGDRQDPQMQLEAVLSTAVRNMAAHPTLCTMLLARTASLSQTELLNVAVEQSVLRPIRELLDTGRSSGTFEFDDAEISAHALYGAITMAALSQFARHGDIDADRLDDVLVPQLVASVLAPAGKASRETPADH